MPTVVLSGSDWPPAACRGGAVTVGNFDGVHRGHAALIAVLKEQAKAIEGPAIVLTFDPHPFHILAPQRPLLQLTTATDRAELLHAAGADYVVLMQTTAELLNLQARAFLRDVLGKHFGVKAVVEGPNFRFGHDRAGDIELLAAWCRTSDIALTVVPPLVCDGVPVSSSRVRATLEAGDVAAAADMLGRPYRLRGTVGTGAKRGHTLGFPTANLEGPETLVPGDGVYAARATLADGTTWPAAANVGPNPTFGETARKVEAHLIGYTGELYGQLLALDFIARLRGLQKFADPEALVEQLRRDVEETRRQIIAGSRRFGEA